MAQLPHLPVLSRRVRKIICAKQLVWNQYSRSGGHYSHPTTVAASTTDLSPDSFGAALGTSELGLHCALPTPVSSANSLSGL